MVSASGLKSFKTDTFLSPSDSIYCCIVNFSDTECGQAGAEIDYSVSFPIEPSLDGLPTVNLPVPLTAARVVECKLGIVPYLVLCSESDCAGGDSASRVSDATPGACADPGFFIQAMQIGY
jgi:hypothetical protein